MDEHKTELPDNEDIEVEITDLDEGKAAADTRHTARVTGRTLTFARRHQRPLSFATLAVMALATLIIVFSATHTQQLSTVGSTASPTAEPATFTYMLDASPPWGHLFVDGKATSILSAGADPHFSLTRGKHTLLWRADPFPPQQCILMTPVGSGVDTCKHPDVPPASGGTDSYISFPTNLDLLPASQRDALIQATRAALASQQSSETVQAGELYAQTPGTIASNHHSCTLLQTAVFCFATANQPLQASLRLQLDTGSVPNAPCALGACDSSDQNCRLFCSLSVYDAPGFPVSQTAWQAVIHIHLLWQFATLHGQRIADNQADTFIGGQQNDFSLQLNISWNGQQWGVTTGSNSNNLYSDNPVCNAAGTDIYTLSSPNATSNTQQYFSQNAIPGSGLAAGCLLQITLQSDPNAASTPTVPPTVAYVMQRFGVLLAVNSAAHRLWPFLPVANAYEKHMAQQWAARQSATTGLNISGVSG